MLFTISPIDEEQSQIWNKIICPMDHDVKLLGIWFLSFIVLMSLGMAYFPGYDEFSVAFSLFFAFIVTYLFHGLDRFIYRIRPKNMKHHDKAVTSLIFHNEILYSSGKDRKLLRWDPPYYNATSGVITPKEYGKLLVIDDKIIGHADTKIRIHSLGEGKIEEHFSVVPTTREALYLSNVGKYIIYSAEEDGLLVYNLETNKAPYRIPIADYGLLNLGQTSTQLVVLRIFYDKDDERRIALETFDIAEMETLVTSFNISALEGKVTVFKQGRQSFLDIVLGGDTDSTPSVKTQEMMELTYYQMVCNDKFVMLYNYSKRKEIILWDIDSGKINFVTLDLDVTKITAAYLNEKNVFLGYEGNGINYHLAIFEILSEGDTHDIGELLFQADYPMEICSLIDGPLTLAGLENGIIRKIEINK